MNDTSYIDDLDSIDDGYEVFAWFTLRVLSVNEDKVVDAFWERVKYHKLEEKIKAIEILKEFKIEESKELLPNSEDLPQRGFKNGKNSVWIKNSHGNYQKIKVVEKRPFKGLAFINMPYDFELFKTIKSWDNTIYFLGDPSPQVMSDSDFAKMKNSLSKGIPDLDEYIKEKNYILVKGNLKDADSIKPLESIKEEKEVTPEFKTVIEKQEEKVKPVEKQTSQPQQPSSKKNKLLDIKKLKVNDFVYVNDFGSQGQIQSINIELNEIVVIIQAFGRRQPIVCTLSQLSEI